ncbi:MAG: hypothetical protein LBT59_13115 [Clostridiales bacterium]|nr:hypothetical protein [Clostridiales bacterium]
MFHVLLVLPILLIVVAIIVAIISVVLVSACTLVLSVAGGAATAKLVKNKNLRKMLFIICTILTFTSLALLSPFFNWLIPLPDLVFTLLGIVSLAAVAVLSVAGIRCVISVIHNKIGKNVMLFLFGVSLVVSSFSAVIATWLSVSARAIS